MNSGIEFQIARFDAPAVHTIGRYSVEYRFPVGFTPEPELENFIEKTLNNWTDAFGALPFQLVRVGAIRRGEKSGEISGSPAGNLILLSRTALKDKPNLSILKTMGIKYDLTDAMRKLVIAHELSHFWFGTKYLGKDGWMVEGIPNYLGLVAVRKESREQFAELLKFFKTMAAQGPQDAIPNHPFGGGAAYLRAYYQGPLALVQIGDAVGHERLIEFLARAYGNNSDPSFAEMSAAFKREFSSQSDLWDRAWRVGATQSR